jgi:ribosome-interacting GTPase 1
MGIIEKIADIEREIARTQKNKGTITENGIQLVQPPNTTWEF